MSNIELIIHPIRIRILTALAGRNLSPQQIEAFMQDVPQTTLYRHIHTLLQANIIKVVSEKQVRGTIEHIYALEDGAVRMGQADLAVISKDDFHRYFLIFLSSVLQDLSGYLESHPTGPYSDAHYSKTSLYLSEADFVALVQQMQALLQPFMADTPGKGRKRFLLTSIVFPDQAKISELNKQRKADS
jgi:DNA-binding transcriptional ArsR family regulator